MVLSYPFQQIQDGGTHTSQDLGAAFLDILGVCLDAFSCPGLHLDCCFVRSVGALWHLERRSLLLLALRTVARCFSVSSKSSVTRSQAARQAKPDPSVPALAHKFTLEVKRCCVPFVSLSSLGLTGCPGVLVLGKRKTLSTQGLTSCVSVVSSRRHLFFQMGVCLGSRCGHFPASPWRGRDLQLTIRTLETFSSHSSFFVYFKGFFSSEPDNLQSSVHPPSEGRLDQQAARPDGEVLQVGAGDFQLSVPLAMCPVEGVPCQNKASAPRSCF